MGGVGGHTGWQDNELGLDMVRVRLQEMKCQGTYGYRNGDCAEDLAVLAEGKISGRGWAEGRPLDDGAQSFVDIHEGNAPPEIILQTS